MIDIQNIKEYVQNKQDILISIKNEVLIDSEKFTFSLQDVCNGLLSMYLPDNINPMNEMSVKLKYPMEDRPPFILTTVDETINFLFTPTNFEFSISDAQNTLDGFSAVIKRLNPSFTICEPQMLLTESDHEIYWVDYNSPVLETDLYNVLYITEIRKTLLIGGFNCLLKNRYHWKKLIRQMIRTISFKDVDVC